MMKAVGYWIASLALLPWVGGAWAQTQPASAPATQQTRLLKLHAEAPTSGEVDLHWYDTVGGIPRYLIQRSANGGKSWNTIGNELGGSATARYDHKDTNKLEPESDYSYRITRPDNGEVLSDVATTTTPARNLLEEVQGQGTVHLTDVASIGFWWATAYAAWDWLKGFLPHFFAAAVLFAVFYLIYRFSRHVTVRSLKRANVDPSIHDLLLTVLKWSILGFAIVMACDQIGVHITALLTGVSIIGLAVGLAAQDTLSNLIASVVIFWDKPFKVGDFISLNSQYGRVVRITFRSTRILTQNGDVIISSNTAVLSTQLVNHSTNPQNWVNVPMVIDSKISIQRVRQALLALCAGDQRMLADPAAKVVVDTVNPGDVKIFLSFCIREEAIQAAMLQEYLEKSKEALDKLK